MDEKDDPSLSDESAKIEDPNRVEFKAVEDTMSESSDCCRTGW